MYLFNNIELRIPWQDIGLEGLLALAGLDAIFFFIN